MDAASKRRVQLFVFVCLPLRILIALGLLFAAYKKLDKLQRAAAVFFLLGGFGFMFRFFTYDEAQRGGAGGKVWWNGWRPVHAVLFWSYAATVFAGSPRIAPLFIVMDTLLGLLLIPTQRRMNVG
tara:strand:- start:3550 stop:3924 length:375 start_codon:yes stop_codon:yes gene_type:complete